ncbi:serine protease [Brevundimonas sp.]|uniref:S1 family peptidase n=1 Tax=Brevundimonas sp. TaxID=1871086 RepID=UPI0025D3292B|nr:serine protease [Brevundimonas sp.]
MFRLPDWMVYGGIIGLLVAVSLTRREQADAPPAPTMPGEEELGALLGPITPFDPQVVVDTPAVPFQPQSGTAFAVSGQGLWLTARHVVEGCGRPAVVIGGGQAVAAEARLSHDGDVALLITEGGPDPLPIARDGVLREGQRGYHPGFPQGRPGEAATRLLGRESLRVRGRGARDEPVLAWAEIGRTEGLEGTLAGLSGAPTLDGQGRVVAVTIAEAPRRGRIYTTAPESLGPILEAEVGEGEFAPGALIRPTNYGPVSDDLRRELRVAQVVCLQA